MSYSISSEILIYFGLSSQKFIPHSNSSIHLLDLAYEDGYIFEKWARSSSPDEGFARI